MLEDLHVQAARPREPRIREHEASLRKREAEAAHRELRGAKGVTELAALEKSDGCASFLFADLNRNWWEVAA